ncbi:hypothetical protein OIU76_008091 [Salix suchowensis]|nr:hypothetical protein OIU76_008091 [Salix suchowensis]
MSITCEIWFAQSWILDQLPKLCPVHRVTDLSVLKERFESPNLRNPKGRSDLAGTDVFVSTADPEKEPPLVTADYPVEKLACYLSDDGGSLLSDVSQWPGTWASREADHSRGDHAGIIQAMLAPPDAEPVFGVEAKWPGFDHNKKAGAMNALVRTSAIMSNGPSILNLDCDHYISNSLALRDGMCFMLDRGGDRICYVQFPQQRMEAQWKSSFHGAMHYICFSPDEILTKGCIFQLWNKSNGQESHLMTGGEMSRITEEPDCNCSRSCKNYVQPISTVEQAPWRSVLQLLGSVPSLPLCQRLDGKERKGSNHVHISW